MTDAAHRAQVIVVGAGPVGFITAYGLARKGIEVRLLEADATIASSPRAALTLQTKLEIVDSLAMRDQAQEIGNASKGFAVRERAGGGVGGGACTGGVPAGRA